MTLDPYIIKAHPPLVSQVCTRCGVEVGNRAIHDAWHDGHSDQPPTEWVNNKIALPHVPDRVHEFGVRCNFCQVRLDNGRRGETCPNR